MVYVSSTTKQMLEDMRSDLQNGIHPLKVYNDEEIYELELRHVFAQSWVFIGHETEIPSPGDYALRYIGEDSFIFARDEDGLVRVLFNSCRHRGTRICRAEKGNASHFRCPFHGWTYKNSGDLIGVPRKDEAYRNLDLKEWGLLRAPKIASYQGLVFASLDFNAPSLEDYLGDIRWYLDLSLKLTGGLEVIGDPHRWRVEADWKIGAEGFSGDSYHTATVHKSALDLGLSDPQTGQPGLRNDLHVTECGGHAISIRRGDISRTNFWGYPKEIIDLFDARNVTKEQYELAKTSLLHVGTVFPNLSFIHFAATEDPKKQFYPYFSLRQWQPKGPGRMEIWNWVLAPKNSPPEYKERIYRIAMSTFSPSGNFETDDIAVWTGISSSSKSVFAEKVNLKLNYQMGMKGMGEAERIEDWPGPGVVYNSNLEDGGMKTFWNSWIKAISRAKL